MFKLKHTKVFSGWLTPIPLHPGDSLAFPRLGSNVEWQAIRRKLMSLVRQATDVTG